MGHAKGDKQKTNLSLNDTFAPVSRISSLQILLALATLRDLHIFTWDVDSAYLHGKINHNIYISFTNGYSKPGMVGKLNKALCGFPKAAWVWHEDFKDKLRTLGYTPLESDPGVFLQKSAKGRMTFRSFINQRKGYLQTIKSYRHSIHKRPAQWHAQAISTQIHQAHPSKIRHDELQSHSDASRQRLTSAR